MAAPSDQQPLIIDLESETKKPSSSFPETSRGNATWHTLVSAPATLSDSLCSGIATCPPSGSLALHHHKQAEIYYILSGRGQVEINGVRHDVSENKLLWIPGGMEHGVFCDEKSSLVWLYVFPEGRFSDIVYHFREQMLEGDKVAAKL